MASVFYAALELLGVSTRDGYTVRILCGDDPSPWEFCEYLNWRGNTLHITVKDGEYMFDGNTSFCTRDVQQVIEILCNFICDHRDWFE